MLIQVAPTLESILRRFTAEKDIDEKRRPFFAWCVMLELIADPGARQRRCVWGLGSNGTEKALKPPDRIPWPRSWSL
jgi:hypothetical protein